MILNGLRKISNKLDFIHLNNKHAKQYFPSRKDMNGLDIKRMAVFANFNWAEWGKIKA
jgi:hypothetical protein